jgi:hypothetical protein
MPADDYDVVRRTGRRGATGGMSVAKGSTVKSDRHMTMTSHFVVALLFGFSTCVSAQTIFRCDEEGHVTYTSRSCARGMEKRVEPDAAPPVETVKMAAARLQVAVADFNARHPVKFSGAGSLDPESAAARGSPGVAEDRAAEDSAWCITRGDDGELVTDDRRNAILLVSVPRRR